MDDKKDKILLPKQYIYERRWSLKVLLYYKKNVLSSINIEKTEQSLYHVQPGIIDNILDLNNTGPAAILIT